ncbi:hypothetical protein Y1Q_0011353 [Alligator mississippiensis]|uniref:Uncharacterized protein n=1 Tax=Alligator mississippiensis TaxID=8496 RepID=A0A151MVL4_ALLMI|nr:hypothetical protein Y1Q_0011353 [Alligator mississippiensis]
MTWVCLSCMLWPEDLEAPGAAHTFKVRSFKKVQPCGICRQAITREGSTCRGHVQHRARWVLAGVVGATTL